MRKAILLIAYGAETPEARDGLRSFEARCRRRFPDLPIRWAYSSPLVRERIAKRLRKSDSVEKALRKLRFENYDAVAAQPLHLIAGREYEEISGQIGEASAAAGLAAAVGKPLMQSSEDIDAFAEALGADLPPRQDEEIIFMGHGSRLESQRYYEALANKIEAKYRGVFIGAMSGAPGLDAILPRLSSSKIILMPLFANVGKHSLLDMAGPGSESWLSRVRASGRACLPILRGLAETPGAGALWLRNLERAALSLDERAS